MFLQPRGCDDHEYLASKHLCFRVNIIEYSEFNSTTDIFVIVYRVSQKKDAHFKIYIILKLINVNGFRKYI